MQRTGAGREDPQFPEGRRNRAVSGARGGRRRFGQRERQDFRQRGVPVAALAESARSPEGQEAAPPLAHEVPEHVELALTEETGLHAAEDHPVVAEEFLAGVRETSGQFLGVRDVHPVELPLRGADQAGDVQLRVARDRPPQELQLPARLSFEIEQPQRPVVHLEQHALLVVAGQHLTGERGHPEPQPPRAGLLRGRQQGGRRLDRVTGEPDVLRGDDPSLVEGLHARRASGESGGAERQPDFEQRTAQDARGHVRDSQFQIGIERGTADRHRVNPDPAGPQVEEHLVEVVLPSSGHGVRAVAHEHDPGHRQRRELVGHPGEAAEQIGARPGEPEFRSPLDPPGVVREAEEPGDELLAEEVAQRGLPTAGRRLTGKGREERFAPGPAVLPIGDLHAPGVVEEDPDDVFLRHDQRQHQLRSKQAEEDERDGGEPRRAEQQPAPLPEPPSQPPVAEQDEDQRPGRRGNDPEDTPGNEQFDLPALERDRRAAQQPLEGGEEHDEGNGGNQCAIA